jgi:hypothetical protein
LDQYTQLLIYLAGPAIVGIVGALIKLWRDFVDYKLHVAERYVKKEDIHELTQDTKEMKGVLYQVAAKLGIAINRTF